MSKKLKDPSLRSPACGGEETISPLYKSMNYRLLCRPYGLPAVTSERFFNTPFSLTINFLGTIGFLLYLKLKEL
jgi:hypothetical protein